MWKLVCVTLVLEATVYVGGKQQQRSCVIAAVRNRQHPECERDRRAAAAAAGGLRLIVGIERRAEYVVVSIRSQAELGDVGLAYNDAAGVTARFNLNVLERINRELGGNFDLSAFTHRAIYNRERHRIEMHLISRKAQSVRVLGRSFSFRAGESIHTESSYKYSLERFTALARGSGWTPRECWTDAGRMFSVHALVASD